MSRTRSVPLFALMAFVFGGPDAHAQDPPSGFEAFELERSRSCVSVLERMEALDDALTPFASRAQRLIAIGQAITLEEASILESLDPAEPMEAQVRDWFAADAELAQEYLRDPSESVLERRSEGRTAILEAVTSALDSIQRMADSTMAATGSLQTRAASCSGAILVRPAVLDACGTSVSRVCDAARDSTSRQGPFRFARSADLLWYVQELRAWTRPTPLGALPDGGLAGARTVGFTRNGNVVVSLAFNPFLRRRNEISAEEMAGFDAVNDALGIENRHPDVVFVPGLALHAALPWALGTETSYMLHFGASDDPDVLWHGPANTGTPVSESLVLAPDHIARLAAGDPLSLTAIHEDAEAGAQAVYTLELTSVNQALAVQALLAYMVDELPADIERLLPPNHS